ncbi:DUF6985 domain-containing protein [Undibacterium sp. Ji49W]|uniref:DUF6985 domain-containing protein n=1 Tax=Undibacterium sp. Ji49W TaxID=3413040 RepID=UPI003BF012EE
MQIPGLGTLEKDEENGWHISQAVVVPALNQQAYTFLLEGYDEADEASKTAYQSAITHFIALDPSILHKAEAEIFAYYQDTANYRKSEKLDVVHIATAADVWKHIQFGDEALVCQRPNGDKTVYVSIECDCDWEAEQGLQIVFLQGQTISKVGPFDDYMSNADAYGEPGLDKVIYQSRG